MNARTGSLRTRLAGVGLVLALMACGDSGSVTTPPTPAPPTPVPPTPTPGTLVLQGQGALQAPASPKGTNEEAWSFTTPADGTIDVTITYLYGDSQILVWVTDRPCTKWQFERDECDYLAKSLEGSSPRKLTAIGVKAGGYSVVVANDGQHDEQIGYQVMLTPGASGSGRGAPR
jgi:uncharacterized lipoprotein YehR (DUF1307 family)